MTYRTNAEQSEPDDPQSDEDSGSWRETVEAIKAVVPKDADDAIGSERHLFRASPRSYCSGCLV